MSSLPVTRLPTSEGGVFFNPPGLHIHDFYVSTVSDTSACRGSVSMSHCTVTVLPCVRAMHGRPTSQLSSQARSLSNTSQTAGNICVSASLVDVVLCDGVDAQDDSSLTGASEHALRTGYREMAALKILTTSFSFRTLPKRFKNM